MTRNRAAARINVKAVVILVVVMGLVGSGVVIGHYVRKRAVANAALAAGTAALGEENWAEACQQLKLYLSKYPDDVDMLEAYARANVVVRPREPGHIGAAMGAYRRLLRHRPGDAPACHTLARLYFYVGDHSEAAHICRQRLEADPQDVFAKLWLGQALVALGKPDEGADILEELVYDHPDQVRAFGVLSYVAGRRDKVNAAEEAARWLDRAVESNPRSVRALTQRARFRRLTRNDAVAAQEDLETAAGLEPDDPNVLVTLATEWLAWNHLDEAQEALTTAAQIDPTEHLELEIDPEGFTFRRLLAASQLSLRRGEGPEAVALSDAALEELSGALRTAFLPVAVELYLVGGRIEKAREVVEELQEAGPSRTERAQLAQEQLALLDAVVSDAEGRPYAVINLMEDLVSTSPQQGEAWKLLSRAYDRTGQARRSREALERHVAQVPGDWQATLGLARAYRQVDWNKVRKYAERVEQADPSVLEAKLLRCESILRGAAGEPTDARRQQLSAELAQLREAFPTSVGVRLVEAYLASGAGRVEQAQSVLEGAIAECDDPLAAELQLAALHAEAGRTDEAIELCLAAMARHPDNAEIPRRLAQLQLAAGRVDDARATLAQAAREWGGRDGLSAALWLAELELARGERTAAIDRLRKLTVDYPDDERAFLALLELPEVLGDPEEGQTLVEGLRRVEGERGLRWQVEQARIWLRQDDWKEHQDQIVQRLTKCIQADSGWATPVLVLGQMYEASGQVVDAERTYRQAVESSPAQFGVTGRLLALLERQGRFAEADQLLRRIPTGAAPFAEHRINVLIGLGEIEPAIEELERWILADPSDATSRVVLAKLVYAQRRDATAALNLLDEAHIASPSLLAALSARAFILHAEDRDDEALALLDSVVAERNDYASYHLRARYHITVEHWDSAERDLVHLTTFPGRKAEALAALGQFHNRQGHVEEAVAAWEAGLVDDPGSISLRRLVLSVLLVSGDTQQVSRGREILDELLVELPNDTVLLSLRAALLLEEHSPTATSEAKTILERVVTLNPRDIAATLQLFELARQRGDFSAANGLIVRALGANPNNALLILAQATLEADRKNLDLAWELARSVLDRAGSDPALLNPLAELALRTGATDLADSLNAKSLELNPGDEIVQVLHANILAWKGQRGQAIRDLESYRQTDDGSRSIRTLLALSESYRVQGDIEIAGQRLDQAASLAPYDRAVLLERCRWLAVQQRYDEMADVVAQYGELYPGESRAHLAGGWLVALGGKASHLARAKSLFEQAVALEPSRVEGHLGLGGVAYQAGDIDGAVQSFQAILELDPFHRQALNDLAWLLGVELNRQKEGFALADKGVARHPADAHLLDTRGVILTSMGRLADALADFERSIAAATDLPGTRARALLHVARVHAQQGDDEAVRRRLDEARLIDDQHAVFTAAEHAEIVDLRKTGRP